jgi:hypothetical protein
MIVIYDSNGKRKALISENPTLLELGKLTIDQLCKLAKNKRGFKGLLMRFLYR